MVVVDVYSVASLLVEMLVLFPSMLVDLLVASSGVGVILDDVASVERALTFVDENIDDILDLSSILVDLSVNEEVCSVPTLDVWLIVPGDNVIVVTLGLPDSSLQKAIRCVRSRFLIT